MKNNKTKNVFLTICVISTLIFTVSLPVIGTAKIVNDDAKTDLQKNTFKVSKRFNSIKPKVFVSQSNLFSPLSFSVNSLANIMVSNETYDEYKPSIITNQNSVFVAYECEDENGTFISMKKSTDHGQTWSDNILFSNENLNFTDPSFTKPYSGGFGFGAFLTPEETSYVYEVDVGSIGNTGTWSAVPWDYSNITDSSDDYIGRFYDFASLDTVSFTDYDIPWIIGAIGDSEFIEGYESYNGQDMPIFLHKDPTDSESSRTIVFFPEITGCSNIAITAGKNATSKSMIYGVCEVSNGTNNNLLFFHGNPDIWGEEDLLRKQYINSSEDFKHPKILAENNHIYIAVETSTKGIVLYHSANYGAEDSWTVYNITSDILPISGTPGYPMLISNNSYLSCAFIESGNLSVTNTLKNDINWSQPVQLNGVNGSVSTEYNSYDLGDMNRAVWTDTRDGNKDIYYHLAFVPTVDVAVIDFKITRSESQLFLPTSNLIEITVENVGDVAAGNIPINITYLLDDGNSSATEFPGLINSIDVGQTTTITRPLFKFRVPDFFYAAIDFAGIESITVELDPEGTSEDSDPGNNVVTQPVDFEKIFPRLAQYEDFLKLLKKLI